MSVVKKIFLLTLLVILSPSKIQAAVIPYPPSITALSTINPVKINFNHFPKYMVPEITPWMMGTGQLGGSHGFLVPSFHTYMCFTPSNIFTLPTAENIIDQGNCPLLTEPLLNASTFDQAAILPLWRRDYYSAFTAHILNPTQQGWTVYTVNHGEAGNNKNMGEILPECAPLPNIGYGTLPCTSEYFWGSYNAFISLSSFPWNQQALTSPQLTHFGPITWPSNGYIESFDGNQTFVKATDGGVRHPFSFVENGYMNIFYEDLSQGSEQTGRGTGIKLIRAPITPTGISANNFRSYFNGSFTDPSLPFGFNLATYYNSFSQKGGRSSTLFPREPVKLVSATAGTGRTDQRKIGEVISFSVARVKNTQWYLGAGYDLSKGVTLRISNDLLNWSDPTVIPGTASNYWQGIVDLQKVPILYPLLANANGDTNTEIDANNFYITGTQHNTQLQMKVVNAIRLKLDATTPLPPPTNSPRPGDANGDGFVNESDYEIWKLRYDTSAIGATNGEFSGDGRVNGVDYTIWLANFGT